MQILSVVCVIGNKKKFDFCLNQSKIVYKKRPDIKKKDLES